MKSAYGSHAKSILNTGATFNFSDGSGADVELTTDNLKAEYLNHIKRGEKTHAGSIFASADLSYSNAPNIAEKVEPTHVKESGSTHLGELQRRHQSKPVGMFSPNPGDLETYRK